jgi:hypothetical protein
MRAAFFPGAVLIALLAVSRSPAAVVDFELVITPLGGSFQYDATIRNNSPLDLTLVSIVDAPPGDPLIDPSLTTPAGFIGLYDSGLGIVDFLEVTSTFPVGVTVSGFQFISSSLPPAFFTTFEALDINGDSISGSITIVNAPPNGTVDDSGSTLALAALAVVLTLAGRHLRARWRKAQGLHPLRLHPPKPNP